MQLAAVKQNGNSIRFINNPSEKVKLAAVKQNGDSIRYINNPSEAVKLVVNMNKIESLPENSRNIKFNNKWMSKPIVTKIWTNPSAEELENSGIKSFRYVVDMKGDIHFGDAYYITHEMMSYEFPHSQDQIGYLYFEDDNDYHISAITKYTYNKVKDIFKRKSKKILKDT